MTPIILDTRALIHDYQRYAPFFTFYENGVKDLVKEAVLTRSFNSPYTAQHHHGHRYARGLTSKVMEDFEYAFERHHDLRCVDNEQPIFDEAFLFSNLGMIQLIAGKVEDAAHALLHRHIRTRLFEIAQEGCWPWMKPRWLGSDLLIYIRLLSPKEY